MLKSPTWLISAVVILGLLVTGVIVGVTSLGGPAPISAGTPVDPTQIFLVRHAEQTEDKLALTEKGQARAELLAERFNRANLTHVCSSHLNRAYQTVTPIAEAHDLMVNQFPEPGSILDGQEVDESLPSGSSIEPMIEALRDLPPGSVALCAAHSGTLLAIMAGLGVEVDPDCDFPRDNCVPGTEKANFPGGFDNLWVVIPGVSALARDSRDDNSDKRWPRASLVNLSFGDPTPHLATAYDSVFAEATLNQEIQSLEAQIDETLSASVQDPSVNQQQLDRDIRALDRQIDALDVIINTSSDADLGAKS